MTNGVFAMPKGQSVKTSILTRNQELPYFSNSTMSEVKEAIIKQNRSEGDDTEELYQSVSSKPRKLVLLPGNNISFYRNVTAF